jgi:3-oxoacyl-[acyl-carrier protein] reductase
MATEKINQQSPPKHALVTGAARGIGRAIAERLASDGYEVTAADVDHDKNSETDSRWENKIIPVVMDVTDRSAVSEALQNRPAIDTLVNNAGIAGSLSPFAELTSETIERVLRINVHGMFIVSQEAVARMSSGATIINIASRGYLGGAGAAHYVASKAGVIGLTRAMATELRWKGIRVNAVAPGMVETRMIEDFTPKMKAALSRLEPDGGAADPSVISDIVSFLAGPASRAMTGQVLLADGGKSLGVMPY